jgi:putative transposase
MHSISNVLAHAGRQGRRVASAFIATTFAQNDAAATKQQWRLVADQIRPKSLPPGPSTEAGVPKLAGLKDEAETDVLAYMTFSVEHRDKLHFDQFAAEGDRRDQAPHRGGRHLPQRGSDRQTPLEGAILLERNDEWARAAGPLHDTGTNHAIERCPLVSLPALASDVAARPVVMITTPSATPSPRT